jgi:hypothetical protein
VTGTEQRGLTWSGKWHIINPHHPDANRYAVARCGAYVYRDDDPRYPPKLKQIKEGSKKSTGICKLCTRSAGLRTATVELPEPDSTRYEGDEHEPMDRLSWQDRGGFEVSNWLQNEVQLSVWANNGSFGSWEAFEPITARAARDLAAALLAAAEAAEAHS